MSAQPADDSVVPLKRPRPRPSKGLKNYWDFDKIDRQSQAILLKGDAPVSAFKVWLVLNQHYSRTYHDTRPSAKLIQQETGLSHGSVWNGLNWLEEHEVIARKKRYDGTPIVWKNGVVVWSIPGRDDEEFRKNGCTHGEAKQHFYEVIKEKCPKVFALIDDGHLAGVVKEYGTEMYGPKWVFEAMDVWFLREGTDFPKRLRKSDDPVAWFHSWLIVYSNDPK